VHDTASYGQRLTASAARLGRRH